MEAKFEPDETPPSKKSSRSGVEDPAVRGSTEVSTEVVFEVTGSGSINGEEEMTGKEMKGC